MAAADVVEPVAVPEGSTLLVLGSLVSDGDPGNGVRGASIPPSTLPVGKRLAHHQLRQWIAGRGRRTGRDAAYLHAREVPGEIIVDDGLGLTPRESCRRARDVFGVSSVVGDAGFHCPAIALCRDAGLDARGGCPDVTIRSGQVRQTMSVSRSPGRGHSHDIADDRAVSHRLWRIPRGLLRSGSAGSTIG